MTTPTECLDNIDALKLVREGTSQDQRQAPALNPDFSPVNEHTPAHSIVFAQRYSRYLKYFNANDKEAGDWEPFFGNDVSAVLAIVSIDNLETYKANTKSWFDFLNARENISAAHRVKDTLGFLYSSLATLSRQLAVLSNGLPNEIGLKATLQNLIKGQLAPAFKRLIAYYKGAESRALVSVAVPSPVVLILQQPMASFNSILIQGLSADWSEGLTWNTYVAAIAQDDSVYGAVPVDPGLSQAEKDFIQINHAATHNLFTSIFDQYLKVFARVISEASNALNDTLTQWDKHDPQYALFLAFVRLLENVRSASNTLTARHLDFYYREVLRLKEKSAEPGHVHLLVELAKQASSREFKPGELFKAGKDDLGRDAFFAADRDFVANQAKVVALKSVYRHTDEIVTSATPSNIHQGRIYASPIANSADGLGGALTSVDQSWHPFYNKVYADGVLKEISMPTAELGFAIASHYLLMAEGQRTITLKFTVSGYSGATGQDFKPDVLCLLTTPEAWLEKTPKSFVYTSGNEFTLVVELTGGDAPITAYVTKTHGYTFATDLPVLLVKLKQDATRRYAYPALQDVVVTGIKLDVDVAELKTVAVSNDFGPVDTAKPFQPFGPSPVAGSALIVGSKEMFQKQLISLSLSLHEWLVAPQPYSTSPTITIDVLKNGSWAGLGSVEFPVSTTDFSLPSELNTSVLDKADFGANEFYRAGSRHGFAKLKLSADFGQAAYQADLIKYLRKDSGATDPGKPPVGPTASALSVNYSARTALSLSSSTSESFAHRVARFFHVTPFGAAEQHSHLTKSKQVFLLPQFDFDPDQPTQESEAELYIGITGLTPAQNLSLLFQVVDGTANPRAVKPSQRVVNPKPHIRWSYLKNNEWTAFAENEVQDETDELLNSGIVSFVIPRAATTTNILLPTGMIWIRAAVGEKSDAVCRLQGVAAQALKASFTNRTNAENFSATPLAAGTISKLDQPDAAVKTINQPFASFGGRGVEQSDAFYTRISERLRHKDRAIALWDYERLVLAAFPQIYKVKCLNHTRFEPSESGPSIYRELAAGHITLVTIPKLHFPNQRDPLKPYTSLGLLQEIDAFLKKRVTCFVKLHVRNPEFESVRVVFAACLFDGFDFSYYSNVLRQAITRFLSPWAFVEGGSPSFGGKIYKSVLINFIEDQPYVDYVTDVQLFRDIDGVADNRDWDEVTGFTAVSILVSAPASQHAITEIKATPVTTSGETCSCTT